MNGALAPVNVPMHRALFMVIVSSRELQLKGLQLCELQNVRVGELQVLRQ